MCTAEIADAFNFFISTTTMRIFQNLLAATCLLIAFSAQAQTIKVTPVMGTNFGTVVVGSSQILEFDVTDPSWPFPGNVEYLRTLVQSTNPGDMAGATPAPGFTLNLGTCVPALGIAGTPLNDISGCRFSVTFAPLAAGAVNTFIIATNEPDGIWDNSVQLTATGLAAPVVAATPASIPTLSEWAVVFMSALLGLFAVVRLRRR